MKGFIMKYQTKKSGMETWILIKRNEKVKEYI